MNALIYAINELHNTIPFELLWAGFTIDETAETVNITSLDDKILNKLFKKRVLLDANIIGGIEMIIPLVNINPITYEYNYTIYRIPPEAVLNKEIISVLNLTTLSYPSIIGQSPEFGLINSSPIINAADRVGNAASSSPIISNANLELVGYNTILVYTNFRYLSNAAIRVIVENDSNLNNISPRSYKAFSQMCVLACKAYLYNTLIIKINSGQLASGQELGMFKSILDSYSSAEEDYNAFLENKMKAVMFFNDTMRTNRFVKSMLQPDL